MDIEVVEIKGVKVVEKGVGRFYKTCTACNKLKPIAAFGEFVSRKLSDRELRYYRNVCVMCINGKDTEDWGGTKRSRKNHVVSNGRWERLFTHQDRRCAICRCEVPTKKGWNIDHDHKCCPGPRSCGKCVRGILCSHCNTGLGQFFDDPTILQSAIDYLSREKRIRGSRSLETRKKIAAGWDDKRRAAQSAIIQTINRRQNAKKDYVCPDCKQEFKKIDKQTYGGHRKTCLYYKQAAEELMAREPGHKSLDEVLDNLLKT
jgi:hypothetical protein